MSYPAAMIFQRWKIVLGTSVPLYQCGLTMKIKIHVNSTPSLRIQSELSKKRDLKKKKQKKKTYRCRFKDTIKMEFLDIHNTSVFKKFLTPTYI